MELKATIDSADFLRAFSSIPDKARSNLRIGLNTSARAVVYQAQQVHRFKTKGGKLENSIQNAFKEDDDLAQEVFFNKGIATYGIYQHDGTRRGIKPDHFIIKAAQVKEPNFQKNISDAISKTIAQAGFR